MNRCCIPLIAASLLALPAVEPELSLGPNDARFAIEILSKQVDNGAERHGDLATRGTAHGRWYNIGLTGDLWMALADDNDRDNDSLELTQGRIRLDYLIDVDETVQVLPFYQFEFFPNRSNADEPSWLGLDVWYLLPWEGLEVGGSVQSDAGGEWGWLVELGARQFFQDQDSGIDIHAWQVFGYGSDDAHRYYGGADEDGFTTFELGGRLSAPLPWNDFWGFLRLELHAWLDKDDRDAIEDDVIFVLGVGIEYRPSVR